MKKIIYLYLFINLFIPQTYASDNFYDLFMQGNKEEAILLLQDQAAAGNNDANYVLALLYNDASSINLCSIEDFCLGQNFSNYKEAKKIFVQLYQNHKDPRAA